MHIHSHFGVYAVILSEDCKSILLIQKARGPYTGLLDLPGGSLEIDELLEDGLKREVKEETSCIIVDLKQIGCFSIKYEYNQDTPEKKLLRHIGVLYHANIMGNPSAASDGEDSNGSKWFEIENLDKNLITPFASIAIKLMAIS